MKSVSSPLIDALSYMGNDAFYSPQILTNYRYYLKPGLFQDPSAVFVTLCLADIAEVIRTLVFNHESRFPVEQVDTNRAVVRYQYCGIALWPW